jgi:hypothetical protein
MAPLGWASLGAICSQALETDVGELLLDVGVLRVIAVSLSGRGPFTSLRIIDGLCDNLRALTEPIWGVTYSAVFETPPTVWRLHAQAHCSNPLYENSEVRRRPPPLIA